MINANKKMEPTIEASFYPDEQSYPSRERLKRLKKSMTLDLESPSPKKQKFSCLLSTPDLNMLKLASPELERLLIQQNGLITGTTPTPGQYTFPKSVTEEQESYVQGFVEALAQLHDSKKGSGADSESGTGGLGRDESSNSSCEETSNSGASTSMSSGNISTNAQTHFSLSLNSVKEEPQTVPRRTRSPPMSPINLVDQERIKLERKRLRNRLAATKCRQMKLEKISKLEQRVKELKGDNDELSGLVSKLRDRICFLKEQFMEHVNNGCKIVVPQDLLE